MSPEINVRFKVNDDGSIVLDKINQKIAQIDKNTREMSKSLGLIKLDSIINLGQRAFQAAERIYSLTRGVADQANAIERNSKTLNMSIESFQKWTYAAKMADVNQEEFMNGMKFMTRSISEATQGSGDAAKAFELMGIQIKDSSGKTKDQQTILLETIGVLEKYADGANRDALMLAVFGRSWMTLKPLINEGTDAIRKNMEEAEKLGTVFGEVLIKKGSEAEKTFKQLEAQVNSTKIALAGASLHVANFFKDALNFAKDALNYMGRLGSKFGAPGPEAWAGKTPSMELPGLAVSHGPGYRSTYREGKPEAPGIPSADAGKALQKQLDDDAKAWGEYADSVFSDMDKLQNELIRLNNEYWENRKAMQQHIMDGEQELTNTIAEAWSAVHKVQIEQWDEDVKKSNAIIESFGSTLSSAWSTNLTNMIKGTESFSDGVKNIFTSIGDAFINTVAKMAANWLIFGNLTGGSGGSSFGGTSGSYGGIIGLVGSILKLQEGGVFDKPTPAIIGEAGPEAVIPLKGGKIPIEGGTGGIMIINYNQVTDPNTFVKIYGPVVKKLSEQSAAEAKRYNRMGQG